LPEEDEDEENVDGGFAAFGLGPLIAHPTVAHYFQPAPALVSGNPPLARLPSAPDLFPHLLAFIQQSLHSNESDDGPAQWLSSHAAKRQRSSSISPFEDGRHPITVDAAAFGEFLKQQLKVGDLREVSERACDDDTPVACYPKTSLER
jgi:hypothetical protein